MVYVIIVLCCGLILVKATYVMTIEGKEWRDAARNPLPIAIAPNRGDIWASDGRILATSVPYYELRFDGITVNKKVFQENIDSLAYCLSSFFRDRSKQYYKEKLTRARNGSHPNRYLLINKRRVNHNELKRIRSFPIFRLGRNKGGFQVVIYDERILPHKNLATRTIGSLNESVTGLKEGYVGLEAAFEKQLKGENGEGVKQMMSGTWMVLTEKEPIDGHDVVTTIDVDYQDIVQHALKKQLEKSEATHGSAILMEVATGDILAIANMANSKGGYVEKQNFAIGDAVEPGSVIKAATMIALLEDGHVRPYDTIDLGSAGKYEFYGKYLHESDGKGVGRVTVSRIMEKSHNGIAKLVDKYYKKDPEKFINRWYSMGLDKKIDICLPGEAKPYIKYPSDKTWSGITLPWMSVGYELEMTSLQILAFYNAIANAGQRMRPRLVKEICNRGEVIESFDTEEVGSRLCSNKTLKELQKMLEGVVENGTAKNIYTPKYRIAGKTGTAQISGAMGYGGGRYRASFVGYFPADKPLYSCIVVIDNPRNGYYATTVAAPVFKEIADKVYSMAYVQYGKPDYESEKSLPISKNGLKEDFQTIFDDLDMDLDGVRDTKGADWVITASNEAENVVVKPRRINFSTVPNVNGMGLRDAIYVLENSGLRVGVIGSGMVRQQSVRAGSEVAHGSYVQIVLR